MGIKGLKRQLDESEEEVSREKAARRKIQRELEDLIAENESKEREINNLKNKLRGNISGSGRRRVDRDRDFWDPLVHREEPLQPVFQTWILVCWEVTQQE